MSTPEETPSDPKPESTPTEEQKEAIAAEKSAAPAADKPTVAKPKFKVTRSPFAPKIDGGIPGAAPKPGPVSLPKDGGAPKPIAPKPIAPKAPAPNPMAKAVNASKPSAAPSPALSTPKPVAPVSARKAAELAEEEDSKFSPILMAVDAIAAIVAIAFGVLIILGTKG